MSVSETTYRKPLPTTVRHLAPAAPSQPERARGIPFGVAAVVLLLMLADGALTLIGQEPTYWTAHQVIRERASAGRLLLSQGPYAFVGSILMYGTIAALVFRYAPTRFALIAAIAVFFGHFKGATSWLPPLMVRHFGWAYDTTLFWPVYLFLGAAMAWQLEKWLHAPRDTALGRWRRGRRAWVALASASALLLMLPVLLARIYT